MPVSNQDRVEILEERILELTQKGFKVINRADYSAQLVRPKRWTWGYALMAIALLLTYPILVPAVILSYWLTEKDKQIYLFVKEDGYVEERKS